MADWLKLRHALIRSAKVRGLMRELCCKKHAALGLAVHWLCWVDEQTTDGQTGLLPDELDEELGFRGGAEALVSIGWADLREDGCVYALEFGKHCGASAKARAETAKRVAKCKAGKKREVTEKRYQATETRYQGNEKTLPENAQTENSSPPCETEKCANRTVKDVSNGEKTENATKERYQGNEKTLPDALPEKNRIEENNIENKTGALYSGECTAGAGAHPGGEEAVLTFMAGQANRTLAGGALEACARCFFEEMEAVGWVGRNGNPVRDWRAMARSYLTKWQQHELGRGAGHTVVRRSDTKPNYDL